jgi:hypothetical protein
MKKIKFQKDIDINSLTELLTCHINFGFFYAIISRKTFTLLAENDLSLSIVDMREQGLGYAYYSYNNLITMIINDKLNDDELIYLKDEDIHLLSRNKKINHLIKEIINF